jgi:phenylalanyl-tRNA synthetase beta subunit
MEYSLYNLNQSCKLKQLSFTNIINKLNLIGFEVDDIFRDDLTTNSNLENIRLLIKIPSNRDDLLTETFFITELTTIFLLDVYESWKKIKQKYFFLLKQNYLKYFNYKTIKIQSELADILIYNIEFEHLEDFLVPLWIEKKLISNGLPVTHNITDLLTLVTFEWGQTINILDNSKKDTTINSVNSLDDLIQSEFYLEQLINESFHRSNQDFRIKLDPGTIVIKDSSNQILSVLGIFNSFPIKLSKNKIIFEAIYYDIEKNNLNLNLINTKISLRFLRKTYLENFKFAFQRLLTLLELLSNSKIALKKYKTIKTLIALKTKRILRLEKKSLKNILNLEKFEKEIFKKANLKLICETPKEM